MANGISPYFLTHRREVVLLVMLFGLAAIKPQVQTMVLQLSATLCEVQMKLKKLRRKTLETATPKLSNAATPELLP